MTRADPIFDALGNATRREILELVRRSPRSVRDIATALPISRPAVSKHLRILADAGLVQHDAQGAQHIYAVAPDGFAPARDWLDQFWDVALRRLAMVAENVPSEENDR